MKIFSGGHKGLIIKKSTLRDKLTHREEEGTFNKIWKEQGFPPTKRKVTAGTEKKAFQKKDISVCLSLCVIYLLINNTSFNKNTL